MLIALQKFVHMLQDESGQDLVEYALLGVFIGLGVVASTRSLASAVTGVFAAVASTLTSAV